jgi:exodeoxyribonuclease VII large subunit
MHGLLEREEHRLSGQLARVRALSPAATLARGYAVVQQADGTVVRQAGQARPGDALAIRLSEGRLDVTVTA